MLKGFFAVFQNSLSESQMNTDFADYADSFLDHRLTLIALMTLIFFGEEHSQSV